MRWWAQSTTKSNKYDNSADVQNFKIVAGHGNKELSYSNGNRGY